jgi:aminoglycoside phosphotransferase
MKDPKDALFHLLVLDAEREALLAEQVQSQLLLPVWNGSLRSRIPRDIQVCVAQFGLRSTVGGVLYTEEAHEGSVNDVAVLVMTHGSKELASRNLRWVPVSECRESHALLPFQRTIFRDHHSWQTALTKSVPIEHIRDWVRSIVEARGRRISDKVSQLAAGQRRSLFRFPTNDGNAAAFYLSGSSVANEAELTAWLVSRRPDSFPNTLGYDPAASRWLIDTIPGIPLSDCLTLENSKCAISALAKIQIDLLGSEPPHFADSSRDFRIFRMASSLADDFDRLRWANDRHNGEIAFLNRPLQAALQDILEQAADLAVPDSFLHCDPAPPNLFLEHGRLRLIDFEEAGWGFPFLALETFLRSEQILEHGHWREDLRREYCLPWRDVVRETQLRQSMALTPIIRLWVKLKRLVALPFETEPERYWHPSVYRYLLVAYTKKFARLTDPSRASDAAAPPFLS